MNTVMKFKLSPLQSLMTLLASATVLLISPTNKAFAIPDACNGSFRIPTLGNWSGSPTMAALNGGLYVIQGPGLYRANPCDGSWIRLGTGDWSGSTTMTNLNGWLYVIQGSGLYRANPNDGSWTRI